MLFHDRKSPPILIAKLLPLIFVVLSAACASSSRSDSGLAVGEFFSGHAAESADANTEAEVAAASPSWQPSEVDHPALPVFDPVEETVTTVASENSAFPAIKLPSDIPLEPLASEEGIVSFYGKSRKTASGQKFDPNAMTAAHKSLPFGTIVQVTRLDTLQSVIVRITDRGPYIKGRIIDLATAPARLLNLTEKGITRCRIDVLRFPESMKR